MDVGFGTIGSVIGTLAASVNSNIGPVVVAPGTISTSAYNMGTLGLASAIHNELVTAPTDFLWTVNRWDDRIHTVAK